MKIEVSAPSNIALIKYMGKIDTAGNRPTNSSFSFTLDELRTFVEIEKTGDKEGQDDWQPLSGPGFAPFEMSENGKIRFLRHFQSLKKELGLNGSYVVRSANNFPSDCGLASSASSFAALTLAVSKLAQESGRETPSRFELAEVSRKGSGSSCRSFFAPWALWTPTGIRPLDLPVQNLRHSVVVVTSAKKKVSSSEAHRRVVTSPLFTGRPERAEARLADLLAAFREKDWEQAYQICWAEFWDMHALFETSKPAFGYIEPGTIEVLQTIREIWQSEKDGPIVTMDAGANVHLLFRDNQTELQKKIHSFFHPKYSCFSSGAMTTSGQG